MKVALLSYEYPPETGYGGIGTYTWYQARALVRLGHDVRVVAGSVEPGVHHGEHDGVKVTRVAERGYLHGAVEGLMAEGLGWAPNRLQTAAGAYHVLRDLLEEEAFDVVEFPECGADGMLVATLLPVPTCVRFHSPAQLIMPMYGANEADTGAAAFFEQVAINQADVRVASSRFLAGEVQRHMAVPPPVYVVPNGIDLELFDREEGLEVRERFGLPGPDAVTVLFSSRLEERKGARLLADICLPILRAHPQVHFVFVGSDEIGAMRTAIRPQAELEGLGDRVHHFGRLPLADVRALLKHVDVHMLPTLWDNAPYAVIEAMAAGRALLTSDCGGMPELIEDGRSGLLARTGDAASFVEGLARLVEDPDLRDRLGREARRTVEERFTDVASARRTVEVWQSALGGGADAAATAPA